MNSRLIVQHLHEKYAGEKWMLSPKDIWTRHDSLNSADRKFQIRPVEDKLATTGYNLWFGLKSGIIFDRHEFLMIGDSMDDFHFSYDINSSIKNYFLKFEGYTLYYLNGEAEKKMTLSAYEVKFFKEYIDSCEDMMALWDWEELTDF